MSVLSDESNIPPWEALKSFTSVDMQEWFSIALKAMMDVAGMKPKEFAFKLGVSKSLIYNYLNKNQPVTWATVDLVERVFHVFDWEPEDGRIVVNIKTSLIAMLTAIHSRLENVWFDTPNSQSPQLSPTAQQIMEKALRVAQWAEEERIELGLVNAPQVVILLASLYGTAEIARDIIGLTEVTDQVNMAAQTIEAIIDNYVVKLT